MKPSSLLSLLLLAPSLALSACSPSADSDEVATTDQDLTSPGAIDTSWGVNGTATVAAAPGEYFGLDHNPTHNVFSLADGRLLLISFESDVAARRVLCFTKEGKLDATFGNGGIDDIGIPADAGSGTWDGKIVFVGQGKMLRLNSDGSVDPTYGAGGIASLPNMPGFQKTCRSRASRRSSRSGKSMACQSARARVESSAYCRRPM